MTHGWRAEREGQRWVVVRLCHDGHRSVFSPCGDPDVDYFETEAAALQMAATLNAVDGEGWLRA